MKKYRLRNDGSRDLTFTGELLAQASSHAHHGPAQNRWQEVDIYRTDGGKYVVRVTGRTCWQGESDRYSATVCADAAAVYHALLDEDDRLSAVARDVLEKAGEADEALLEVAVEEVA